MTGKTSDSQAALAAAPPSKDTPPVGRSHGPLPVRPGKQDVLSDKEIVRRVLSGEPDLFEEIVYRYQSGIYRHVYGIVRHTEEAQDLTQDTFVKAFSKLASYHQGYSFKAWLYRIATNTSISHLRKRRPQVDIDGPDGLAYRLEDDSAPDPAENIAHEERTRLMKQAIGQLPEETRMILHLRYQEEMPIKDVAHAIGKKPHAVTVILHRARLKLRDMVTAMDPAV